MNDSDAPKPTDAPAPAEVLPAALPVAFAVEPAPVTLAWVARTGRVGPFFRTAFRIAFSPARALGRPPAVGGWDRAWFALCASWLEALPFALWVAVLIWDSMRWGSQLPRGWTMALGAWCVFAVFGAGTFGLGAVQAAWERQWLRWQGAKPTFRDAYELVLWSRAGGVAALPFGLLGGLGFVPGVAGVWRRVVRGLAWRERYHLPLPTALLGTFGPTILGAVALFFYVVVKLT